MKNKYYTFIGSSGNKLFHRYVQDGERHIDIIHNYPYELFIEDEFGKHRGLKGEKLKRVEFDNISDMKAYIRKVGKDKIHGNLSPVQQFIVNEYPDDIHIDDQIYKILLFDIETNHARGISYYKYDKVLYRDGKDNKEILYRDISKLKDNDKVYDPFYKKWLPLSKSSYVDQDIGFPNPEKSEGEILSIVFAIMEGKSLKYAKALALHDYKGKQDIDCESFKNEKDLITAFIDYFKNEQPDIISDWFGTGFDLPYLIERGIKIVGKNKVNQLSPFYRHVKNPIQKDEKAIRLEYDIYGIVHLDYQELYKKFSKVKRERYKLDYIGEVELNQNKVDYSEYKNSLMNLYSGVYDINSDSDNISEKDRWARLRTKVGDYLYGEQ